MIALVVLFLRGWAASKLLLASYSSLAMHAAVNGGGCGVMEIAVPYAPRASIVDGALSVDEWVRNEPVGLSTYYETD